jgi:hypothetical protein
MRVSSSLSQMTARTDAMERLLRLNHRHNMLLESILVVQS